MSDVIAALLEGRPLLDVRAPVEYAAGAIPGAINLPILTDDERHQVGLCYKEQGPEAALSLGRDLVSGKVKAERVAAWSSFFKENPEAWLYCFRGGQRSGIAEQWLRESGLTVRRIDGGYKRVRQLLLEALDTLPSQLPLKVLSGQTGSGKTRLLRQLMREPNPPAIIDLEALANHRGSAFGNEIDPQPSQVDFENRLAVEFLRHRDRPPRSIWLEDESRTIGRIGLRDNVFVPLRKCPMIVITEPMATRAQLILEEYVIDAFAERQRRDPKTAHSSLAESLLEPVRRIHKTLGGVRTQEALTLIEGALADSRQGGNWESHLPWIEFLLQHYYDPFYTQHLERQAARIVFRGSRPEVADFIKSN